MPHSDGPIATPRQAALFLLGGLAASIGGLVWGIREGGMRGNAVVFLALVALGCFGWICWLMATRRRR